MPDRAAGAAGPARRRSPAARAWVSETRLKVLPLVEGEPDWTSDGHGFDFRFGYDGIGWRVEVKATRKDEPSFDLGLSEIQPATDIASLPRDGRLDDWVQFVVDLPPGSERGALVDRTALRKAGVESAPSYRLALSLAFWWHDPGKMRTPTQRGGKGRGKLWRQTRQVERYPVVTDAELIAITCHNVTNQLSFLPASEKNSTGGLAIRTRLRFSRYGNP